MVKCAAGLGVVFLGKDIAGLMLGDPSLGNPVPPAP